MKKLLATSLLTIGAIVFSWNPASAQALTCEEAISFVENEIYSRQRFLLAWESSQLGGPPFRARLELQQALELAQYILNHRQCGEYARRYTNLPAAFQSGSYSLNNSLNSPNPPRIRVPNISPIQAP